MDDSFTGVVAIVCFSLYADLQNLSAQTEGVVENDAEWVALPTFSPRPTPAGRSPPTSPKPSAPQLSLHSRLSRIAFSACFAEIMTLVLLLVLQTLDIFSSRSVVDIQRVVQHFLFIFLLLVLIPLVMTIVLSLGATSGKGNTAKRRAITIRFVLNVIPVLLFLVAFSYVPFRMSRYPQISGLHIVPFEVLGTIANKSSPSYSLTRVFQRLNTFRRRHQISGPLAYAHSRRYQPTEATTKVLLYRAERRSSGAEGLEALEHQMSLDLNALRQRRQTAIFSATLKGRLYNLGGRLFSIYCIIRVISVRVIILSSIRLVLRGVTRVATSSIFVRGGFTDRVVGHQALHVSNRSLGASLMLLVLAQLMGIYMLSTIVQLRSTFPPPPTDSDTSEEAQNLFSLIPKYEVFGSLFDWSFVIAAAATSVVRWGAEKMGEMS
ncbi:G protein-coupled receptor [Salix suchowensis]|nr:G protein-coupled receptor [Salix suchowensis]